MSLVNNDMWKLVNDTSQDLQNMVKMRCYRAYFFHSLRPTQGGTVTQDDIQFSAFDEGAEDTKKYSIGLPDILFCVATQICL